MRAVVRVQCEFLGLRMGIMPGGKRRVVMRMVGWMGKRMVKGVVPGIFPVTLPVLARSGSGIGRGIVCFGFRRMSGCHRVIIRLPFIKNALPGPGA